MLLNIISVIIGVAGLYFGAEWLVKGASRLARSFGMPALVIGLTVVAFGTSLPELLVSLDAALQGSSDISVGNIVGSNIANIGLILGVAGIIFPIVFHDRLIWREIPIMVGAAVLMSVLSLDGTLGQLDGVILLVGFAGFNVLMYRITRHERQTGELTDADLMEGDDDHTPVNRVRELLRVLAGLALLVVGARLTVDGAVAIAQAFGISQLFIGLTLVAVGTSLPELATSVVAAMRHESDIAVGNVIGSNIFNILLILGLTSVISPIAVSEDVVRFDLLIMIGFAAILVPFARNREVSKRESLVLLVAYIAFILFAFFR